MQDPITLIEKIQQNQAEISNDLELLKDKEGAEYIDAIQFIQDRQSDVAAQVAELEAKIREDKGGSK